MSMRTIITVENDILHQSSSPLDISELENPELRELISDMKIILEGREDGLAISAPQVGDLRRLFVVAPRAFAYHQHGNDWDEDELSAFTFSSYINPKIINRSQKTETVEEGCLSIPNTFGPVERPTQVSISYLDEHGQKKKRGAGGLLARIFQHEIDHLNGILFTDKAKEVYTRQD